MRLKNRVIEALKGDGIPGDLRMKLDGSGPRGRWSDVDVIRRMIMSLRGMDAAGDPLETPEDLPAPDREETWWGLLELPEGADDGLDFCGPRMTALRELLDREVYIVRGGQRTIRTVQDDKMLEEAKVRASRHPEVAAAVICSGRLDGIEEYLEWQTLAGTAFRSQVAYTVGKEYFAEGDPTHGIRLLEESASVGYEPAQWDLAMRCFLGYGIGRNLKRFGELIGTVAEDGDAWSALFVDIVDDGGESKARPVPDPYCGRRPYLMLCTIGDLPEAEVLSDIGFLVGPDDGYGPDPTLHNGTFMFRPSSDHFLAGEAWTTDREKPNLCFYPTGLEVSWEDGDLDLDFQEVRTNRPVSVPDIRRVMRICIQSLIDGFAGGANR